MSARHARSVVLAGWLVLGGCAATAHDVVARQASFDLECPADELVVQQTNPARRRHRLPAADWNVRGCGERATYQTFCESPRRQRRCRAMRLDTVTDE